MNPFIDDIVHQPRRIEKPIEGLNDKPLRQVLDRFQRLVSHPPPRVDCRLPQALLVTSSQAGYGKSHLIGRLFKELSGKATLIYLRPFADPEGCWQYMLLQIIQEMDFPDRAEADHCPADQPRQLESFARGVLAHLMADLISAGKVRHEQVETAVEFLRKNPGLAFDLTRADCEWARWMRAAFPQLRGEVCAQLRTRGVDMARTRADSWLRVLYHLAFLQGDEDHYQACVDWLCGRSISEENAGALALRDRPAPDASLSAAEQLARDRVMDLCRLASFFRPFVFCFDQTENYASSPDLVRQWAVTLEEMVNGAPNSLTLITANVDPWERKLRPHFEEAHRHRIQLPPLELEGLTRDQAEALISQRLEGVPAEDTGAAFRAGDWLDAQFQHRRRMGARQFLHLARARWDQVSQETPAPAPTLEDVYKSYFEEIRARPRRLCFDPVFFQWLLREVARRVPEVSSKARAGDRHFPHQWEWRGGIHLFGVEGGHNWSRWQSLMRQSCRERAADRAGRTVSVFFRTSELRAVPGNWRIADELREAMASHMRMVILTRDNTAAMYACKDMHSDAVQGNLAFSPEQVLEFTAGRLRKWWELLTGAWEKAAPPAASPAPAGPMAARACGPERPVLVPAGEPELASRLRSHVSLRKFVSGEEALTHLGPACNAEALQRICGRIPEIHVFKSTRMTVLQWQPSV